MESQTPQRSSEPEGYKCRAELLRLKFQSFFSNSVEGLAASPKGDKLAVIATEACKLK